VPDGEKASYILARNGLFFRREHPFFTAVTPARSWPNELEPQEAFLESRFPKIRRKQFERIVGFFDHVRDLHGAEAAVLLAWDPQRERVRLTCPDQTATMGRGWVNGSYPIGLHYERPIDLPPGWFVFGDVHSHVDAPAYASGTDKYDEEYLAGLHVVVGRLYQEPPDVHIEVVVDGVRFPVAYEAVVGGYEERRSDFPSGWIDRLQVKEATSWGTGYGSSYRSNGGPRSVSGYGSSYGSSYDTYGSSYGSHAAEDSSSSDDDSSSAPDDGSEEDAES